MSQMYKIDLFGHHPQLEKLMLPVSHHLEEGLRIIFLSEKLGEIKPAREASQHQDFSMPWLGRPQSSVSPTTGSPVSPASASLSPTWGPGPHPAVGPP